MIVIQRSQSTTAIEMHCVEYFKIHNHGPYNTLYIRTKSGKSIEVHHPKTESGEVVDFNVFANAFLSQYTMWRIIESDK